MKFIKICLFMLFLSPCVALGASNDFMVAAQLLAAAKNADVQQVQSLVNAGADVNFVDSTGLSIVCTALMNNDVRAAQILQMYGADASKCDRQIKKYNSKNKPKGGGGLFSGLSTVQSVSLAAAGAAVVVGGLLLLTDVFDPGNDNDAGGSGGNRPDNNPDSGGDSGASAALAALPYGPAMPTAELESQNYVANLDAFSPSDKDAILAKNFNFMTDVDGQNYLLMMHGYSPLARGYTGMQTLRNSQTLAPLDLAGIKFGDYLVQGGRPVNVALVTEDGINAANKPADEFSASKNSLDDKLLLWTTLNANSAVNPAGQTTISSKYYNNQIIEGADKTAILDDSTVEADGAFLTNFDIANWGTVINNPYADTTDNKIAKVVGGDVSGYEAADYVGFMPNGQMTIYRTGNGMGMLAAQTVNNGEYQETTDGVLNQITLFGKTLDVTMNGNAFVATDGSDTYDGYIGTNGYLYIANNAGGDVNQAYSMRDGNLTLTYELGPIDYMNYKGLLNAMALSLNDVAGRSKVDVIANSSVISPLYASNVELIEDVMAFGNKEAKQMGFGQLIDKYYDAIETDYKPSVDANSLFGNLGATYRPLVIFSTGGFETDSNYSGRTLSATFENAVPLAYDNTEHFFMSVVPVGTINGTTGATSVSGYSQKNQIAISQWVDDNGTPDDSADDKFYKGRMCGLAGTGVGNIDPWCFAAAGQTDELAVSSAAGAVGVVKSAFSYLNNAQLFALLALTADGPWLGTATDGEPLTVDSLTGHLKSMYWLPQEYQALVDNGADYLDVFAQVYGYGLINLERATKPGTTIYYYNGNDIVSTDGKNAYWRAATNTMFKPSAVLNLRGATIRAPFYDVLTSVDGKLSLPRVWENEFALGGTNERGLYMGDVLGDLRVRTNSNQVAKIGNLDFSMSMSERTYVDNLNGLDNLKVGYSDGNWNFSASYQRYLTDGQSRFNGMMNPLLALASNAVVSDIEYNFGKWAFGARAFSGAITDEGLLENDPTISSQFMPAKLGLVHGVQSNVMFDSDKFSVVASVGNVAETNTLLGAYSDGLINMGAGNTLYVDTSAVYRLSNNFDLTARATFARTVSDVHGDFVLGMSDIYSDAFALGMRAGHFDLSVSAPLAVRSGTMQYAYADYSVIEMQDGGFELKVNDMYVDNVGLVPDNRELRFMGAYRHKFGEFTDGAFGFIYRVNPNHTDEFGDESIFMMKLSHRLGI